MESQFYWISAATYAVVLGIILFSDIKANKKPSSLEKSYRLMSKWVLFFCVQDIVWGMCDAKVINNDAIFFLSSSVFHISTVITTFFWLKYVLEYLGDYIKFKKLYLVVDGIVIFFEFVLVIANFFTTTLFSVVGGRYVTGPLRTLTFVNQYVVYLAIGVVTLVLALKRQEDFHDHYRSVFLFTLAPILLGICQLKFPNAPFYSLGYFMGCFIIHIFVVAKDREAYLSKEVQFLQIAELNKKLEAKQVELDNQFEILKSITGVFDCIYLVDFEEGQTYRFDGKESVSEAIDIRKDSYTSLNKGVAKTIVADSYDRFWNYTNLSTLDERMKGKKLLTEEFRFEGDNWLRAMYIRVGEDVNAPLTKVAYALRNITKDRKREDQVYSAMANLVYSLHIFDLENDSFESLIESDILKRFIGTEKSAQTVANILMRGTSKEEYVDYMLAFADFSTVSERLKGKKFISCEFVGRFNGWTRMTFVPIETDGSIVKKMIVITQIIDSEKNEMINLVYKSSTDELTRLYNRRMYEEELDRIANEGDFENLIIVALDVNGLKRVNDTLGHKAGDELIIGAAHCMDKEFSLLGKVYRTGGDEFMAILRCDIDRLKVAFESFDQDIKNWSGNLVGSLSISYGYVDIKDYAGITARELASEADKRMYEAKAEYYRQSGNERRRR